MELVIRPVASGTGTAGPRRGEAITPAETTTAMQTRIEVLSNEWAGTLNSNWRPAIAGTLNQTNADDETASTFPSLSDAQQFVPLVMEQNPKSIRLVNVATGQQVACWDSDDDGNFYSL